MADQITNTSQYGLASYNIQGMKGSLDWKAVVDGSHKDHRIPGSSYQYQCSSGFDFGEGNNTRQEFSCTAGRKVDFRTMAPCYRKLGID